MFDIEKIAISEELKRRGSQWDELLAQSSRPTVFSSFEYFVTSAKHFGDEGEIFILFFKNRMTERLEAIFPLSSRLRKIHGIWVKELSHGVLTAESDMDKPYPIIRNGMEKACWEGFASYLNKNRSMWDVLNLDELWSESFLVQQLEQLFPQPRFWTRKKPGPQSPIVPLSGDWDEFWMEHRKLRKRTRKLEKVMGDNLFYEVTNKPEDVERCLDAYIATELISWKAGRFVSSPKKQAFYRELLPKLAKEGRLFFGMLQDREHVVSIEVAYGFKDRIFFAHGTYDPAYADLSPGTVNSGWLIQYLHGKGYSEGDYLAGFSSYNNSWACRIEDSVDIIVRRMGWKNGYLALYHLARKTKAVLLRSMSKPIAEPAPETNDNVIVDDED